MAWAPDGRLFVTEQRGKVRVIRNDGVMLPTPFVTVSAAVNSAGEQGLNGIAFDPGFALNGYAYLYYTVTTPTTHNRITRWTADPSNPNVALPGSESVIMDLDPLPADMHMGGALHFGPDGKLYVATGDGHVPSNAQTLENRLGKILRINPDGTIPTDNPFYATASGPNRAIWALGLRNPWTFSFHPATGRMFINDVGEGGWEEINDGVAGANYGWPTTEGYTTDPRFSSPVFA